jgi:hypothetical protein
MLSTVDARSAAVTGPLHGTGAWSGCPACWYCCW